MATFRFPVNLTWTGATGSPGVNVFHGRSTGALPSSTDVNGLSAMLEDFYTEIASFFPSTVTITAPENATGVGDDEGDSTPVDPWTVQGTGGSAFLPPADCMLVQWRTGSGGRRGRGKTFIGPCADTLLETNGTPGETARSLLLTAAENLVESSDSFGNGAWGVYSRVGNVFRDWQTASVPNIFAVLRSRRD